MITNASKDTYFGRANDTLSRLVTSYEVYARGIEQAYEEMNAWDAPSECWPIIGQSLDRMRAAMFEEYDITEEEFFEEVTTRTSSKWVHFNLASR